jgi:hypothetical protein
VFWAMTLVHAAAGGEDSTRVDLCDTTQLPVSSCR